MTRARENIAYHYVQEGDILILRHFFPFIFVGVAVLLCREKKNGMVLFLLFHFLITFFSAYSRVLALISTTPSIFKVSLFFAPAFAILKV